MLKTIILSIPDSENVPEIISTFTPEEIFLMLKIGSNCLLEGRKSVAGLSQQEIYKKIKDESKIEIEKLQLDIFLEKELSKKMEERITNMYELQNDQYKKQIDLLRNQVKTYELENKDFIQQEVNKARDKFDLLLQEKENQNRLNRETIEKLNENVMKITNKSTSHKGSEGEKTFCQYAETFMDFKGFEIFDKHTQGGEGDFHLHFEEFDVLVDAKNYKKKVPIDQREKIKNDLLKNEHLHFAWLVSLNTTIDKFDKSPIMYEWVNTTQCIVYINNLSSFDDPKKILRIVWFTCKELYKLIDDVNLDESEITSLKEKNFKLMDKIKVLRKTIREINTSMNATRNLIQVMDDELRVILESETTEIIASNFSLFDEWWNKNIEPTTNDSYVISTDLWTRFKQENKIVMNELNITGDKFKQYIKSKVPPTSLILKNKNINSAFDIKGIKLRVFENTIMEEKIDLVLNEEAINKKKVYKKK
jgi:hypothetical protein